MRTIIHQRTARMLVAVTMLAVFGLVAGIALAQQDQTPPTETDEPWVELKKGLKIRDLVVGTGDEARRGKLASMRYTGWLADGTQFDSNLNRKLLVFKIGGGQVIKGWELGIVGMRVGGTRQILIPAKLGYGKRGIGDRIPPNADLLFEVRLRGVS